MRVELPRARLLYTTLLTPERDDLIPELGIGSQHPVIAVAMDAWRVNEQGKSLEELEGGERESRGTVRCGMGETIDDALDSGRTVPGGFEPFEGEGRTSTVAKETFEQAVAVEGTARSVVPSTRWRTIYCSWSQSETVRWVTSWNWTEPRASSPNTPSMTQTWKWK